MTGLLLLVAIAAGPLPDVVRTVPGGPVLLPELGLAVWQGEVLRAEPLCEGTGGGLWQTRDGAIAVRRAGTGAVWARAWGRSTRESGTARASYLCASQANPLGGPSGAGALICDGEGYWRVSAEGACERLESPEPRSEWAALFILDTESGKLGAAPAAADLGGTPRLGAADARGLLGLPRGTLFADLARLLPLQDEGEERDGRRGAVGLHLTAERALGLEPIRDADGLLAPFVLDLGSGQVLVAPRPWLSGLPEPRPWARAVDRAGAEWLELPSLSAELRSGEVRLNWSDPAVWAPSPDGEWATVLDAYGSARPFAAPNASRGPLDVWLALVPEGDEFESPLRRPSTRWAVSVSREYGGPWPPLGLAPVWSPEGTMLASGRLVVDATTGAEVARLEADAVAVAFVGEERVLYLCHGDGEPVLRERDLESGLSEDLDPRRAAPPR